MKLYCKILTAYFVSLILSCVIPLHAQLPQPQIPQFSTFQPVNGNTPYQNNYPNTSSPTRTPNYQTIENQNRRLIQNTVSNKQAELDEIMKEVRAINTQQQTYIPQQVSYKPNPERTKNYPASLQYLKDMLAGKHPLSVAEAYFSIENAYGDCYLTKKQYDSIINQSVSFIKTWMQQQGLDAHDNYMVQFAIKKFMSEHLTIRQPKNSKDKRETIKTTEHLPFYYDYDDYECVKDYRNHFVTKCLATGFGQCASMPVVYLILAEKLGVKSYLSIAPQHSFVKYPDNSGNIINYEPTSNWEISDRWYMDDMFISAEAIKSGIFLDTLNYKQVVANCIFDLGMQYVRADQTLKEDFIVNCIKSGNPFFPKNNNLESLFLYSIHLKTMLREIIRHNNITNFDDIDKIPEAKAYYKEYLGNEAYIAKLGYRDLPTGMYEEMMKQQEFKGRMQEQMNVNTKEKRNLFQKTNNN